jgi:hypothetical protein
MKDESFLHQYSALNLITRAVRSSLWQHRPRQRRCREVPLWYAVSEQFCLGSAYSRDLCERVGLDADLPAYTFKVR